MAPARTRQPDSLASTVADLVSDFEVPVPTDVVRVIASERRGTTVTAEQLGRLAANERKAFLGTSKPPFLCQAIDRRSLAVRPRLWALGSWRLARRIATTDAIEKWQVQVAVALIDEILFSSRQASEELAAVTSDAIARVLGPIAVYLPGPNDQWAKFQQQIRQEYPDHSPGSFTVEQRGAEEALKERNVPAVSLYFGAEVSVLARSETYDPVYLRLAGEGELGQPFDRIAGDRLSGDEDQTRTLLSYLQAWAALRDELKMAPSMAEFADRWRMSAQQVAEGEAAFRAAFPEETSPEPTIRMLEEGLPNAKQLAWILGIKVIDRLERDRAVSPAPGQQWTNQDGATLTVTRVEGPVVYGHLDEEGRSEMWVADRPKLEREYDPPPPPADLWLVRFDVDVLPRDLMEPLTRGGLAPTRLARPTDPHPDRPQRAGLIEAQVVASNAAEARQKVIAALSPEVAPHSEEISVRQLAAVDAPVRFEIVPQADGHYWRLVSEDDHELLRSPGTLSKGQAAKMIERARDSLMRSTSTEAASAEQIKLAGRTSWHWYLNDSNGLVLGESPVYQDQELRESRIETAQAGALTAPVVENLSQAI